MSVSFPLPSFNCRVDCGKDFDAARIRADFPVLARQVHGRPIVYLDNAATTQKPRHTIAALVEYYERHNANVHRGIHTLAEEATDLYEQARRCIAAFVGAHRPEELIFTRNATEGLNLLAYAWGRSHLAAGDEVLISEMEHHSNIVPWQMLATERGIVVRWAPIDDEGRIDREAFRDLLSPRTRVVSLIHASNVLGTINPVAELFAEARTASPGVLTVLDATQTVPQMPVRFRELGCDAMVFSGHKMYGPTGIGCLVVTEALAEAMPPFLGGGEMIDRVTQEGSTFARPPHRFEAGTPNIADAVALGATVEYLDLVGMESVRIHSECLAEYALEQLSKVPSLTVYGPRDAADRVALASFFDRDVHPHDLATILDRQGVAVRAGHHCAMPLARRLGVPATARASFGIYNTRDEVDLLVQAIRHAREYLGHVA